MATDATMKWTRDMTMLLIDLYKSNECLWNRKSTQYRNRTMKTQAIMNITHHLGINAEEVLRKLHNLRCQLNSEIRKVVKKRKEGVNYNSAWDLFDTLMFISDVTLPKVANIDPTINRAMQAQRNHSTGRIPIKNTYQIAVVKKEVLDDLIEVKYEIDDNQALYPFVQLYAESSQSPEEPQVATLHAGVEPEPTCSEPPRKRPRENNDPDGEVPIITADYVECHTPDVFVDNPMADDGEDDARVFGDFVAAEMSRIRSDERRKSLKKTIEEAVKAMVEEDEKEFFQDPATDPLS